MENQNSGLQDLEISFETLKKPSYRIGSGVFGRVFGAKHGGRVVAQKILKHAIHVSVFYNEIHVLRDLNHPHIPKLHGFSISPDKRVYVIIMEKAKGLNLYHFLKYYDAETSRLIRLAAGIVKTLAFLHERNILLRDLKPDNIVVDPSNFHHMFVDFGLAVKIRGEQGPTEMAGTPGYMAPEVILEKSYSYPADIYSYGMTLYYIMIRQEPSRPSVMGYSLRRIRPEITEVIARCIETNPSRRPAASYVVQSLESLIQENPTSPPPLWERFFSCFK